MILLHDINTNDIYKKKELLRTNIISKRDKLLFKLNNKKKTYFAIFKSKVNMYLGYLGCDFTVEDFYEKKAKVTFKIITNNIIYNYKSNNPIFQNALSEGEKNCLAFSFFMARLEMISNIEDYIIVFDDPICSQDSMRRSITISQLANFSRKVNQFIVLSHDEYFIKEFCERRPDALQLQIVENKNEKSIITSIDINEYTKDYLYKDIDKIKEYASKGNASNINQTSVIRAIRPVIEGLLRIKYYGLLEEGEWIGSYIQKLRNADCNSPFYREDNILDEIIYLNDATKKYHHGNGVYSTTPISENELKNMCFKAIHILHTI